MNSGGYIFGYEQQTPNVTNVNNNADLTPVYQQISDTNDRITTTNSNVSNLNNNFNTHVINNNTDF